MNDLEVSCYSGHTYAQRPTSFHWQGINYEVAEIEKEWQEPGKRCFQVRTADNKQCRLCYNELHNRWSITEFVQS
jgi:hypothetical protein